MIMQSPISRFFPWVTHQRLDAFGGETAESAIAGVLGKTKSLQSLEEDIEGSRILKRRFQLSDDITILTPFVAPLHTCIRKCVHAHTRARAACGANKTLQRKRVDAINFDVAIEGVATTKPPLQPPVIALCTLFVSPSCLRWTNIYRRSRRIAINDLDIRSNSRDSRFGWTWNAELIGSCQNAMSYRMLFLFSAFLCFLIGFVVDIFLRNVPSLSLIAFARPFCVSFDIESQQWMKNA